MGLDQLWQIYCNQGYEAVKATPASDSSDIFYLSLLAFGEQNIEQAADYAQQATEQAPDNLVYSQASTYLHRVLKANKQNVYVTGEGFAAFIRGGGNISLYQETSAALRVIYQEYETLNLLDIGVGDGLALLPALTDNIRQLDLLEPSEMLLNKTSGLLHERGIQPQAICATLQQFAVDNTGYWDVIEATYSLQSIPPVERSPLFKWLYEHGQRILIAEFDVPDFSAMYGPDRVQYIVERYENGLTEYANDGGLVAQGFLMPVMFGYFDQTANRTNYEQPLQKWVNELKAGGFQAVQTRLLYSYWWAPAYLIDAC